MDAVGLTTLETEVRDDLRVMREALAAAQDRFRQPHPAGLEAAAHHLQRFYNAFEQTGLRLAQAFENHIGDASGWHSTILQRLALEIPGVRPALLPPELKAPLNELRGFRHVVVHAYDLVLDPARVGARIDDARRVMALLPEACDRFFTRVRADLRD